MPRYGNISYATDKEAFDDGTAIELWSARRQGYAAWTYNPLLAAVGGSNPTAGITYLSPIIPRDDCVVNNLDINVFTAGATLTAGQCFMGLYDASGTRLAISADLSGVLTSGGPKSIALTSSATLTAGSLYYVALLQNGTTPAKLSMAANDGFVNQRVTRFFRTTATGLTALPTPLGAVQAGLLTFWAGLY